VRVADRVDPLSRVPCLVEPVRIRGLHLNHALYGSDSQRGCARGEELPQVPLRLRHLDQSRLEDGEGDVRREAPVAEPHHTGPNSRRHLVPVAHVLFGELVVPAVLDQPADRDPVADQRDVEDEEAEDGEPERALSQAVAGQRPLDDSREHQPAEPRREQRPAADDHHVRVRQVAHEVSRVAGASQVLGHPGQVLDHHVQRTEDEEETARDEVLRGLAVVRTELVIGERLPADRRRLARDESEHRRDDDREKRDVGQELERSEVSDVQDVPGASAGRARGRRRPASSRGRRQSAPPG